MPDEFLEDDHYLSSDFIFVEAVPDGVPVRPQALWIGVRPGYDADGNRMPEPTIWVQYQEAYMGGPLTGMVAMSPESWDKLNGAVRWRLAEWRERSEPDVVLAAGRSADHGGDSAEGDQFPGFTQPELPFPVSGGDRDGDRHEEVMHPDHRS